MSFGTSDGHGGCPGDTFGSFYNAAGNLLVTDDNGGNTPPCARLDVTNDRGSYETCFTSKDGGAIGGVVLLANERPRVFLSKSAERKVLITTPSTTMKLADWDIGTSFTPDYHVHP